MVSEQKDVKLHISRTMYRRSQFRDTCFNCCFDNVQPLISLLTQATH
jgi:hypothetical protein